MIIVGSSSGRTATSTDRFLFADGFNKSQPSPNSTEPCTATVLSSPRNYHTG